MVAPEAFQEQVHQEAHAAGKQKVLSPQKLLILLLRVILFLLSLLFPMLVTILDQNEG